ncbi:MAG: BACON domain-containing protein [Bryobacteraceae bacterium]
MRISLLVSLAWAAPLAAAPSVKVSPAALVFTFQEGAATLPAAQTLAVSAASSGAVATVQVSSGGSLWLAFTPLSGKTALSVKVSVNPTSLPVGQYAGTITLSTPETGGDPVTVPVTLNIKSPPSDLKVAPATLSVTYRLGDAAPPPAFIYLTTTGGLLSFTAAVTGAKWMRVTPASGAVFPGFRTGVAVAVDVADLTPGTQKGTVTLSAPDAVTKTTSVAVNLTVQPGQAVATTLWPPRIIRGAVDSTVTITGQRFFSGTTVKSGNTALKTTILGPNVLTAVVPSSLLANPGTVPIVAANPDPGGGAAQVLNLEVLPPGPLLLAVVNAASQRPAPIAPGSVFTLYGSGLGPDTLTAFDGSTPSVPAAMSGTRVLLNGSPMPVIYSSARQVSAAGPNDLVPDRPFMLEVEYNGVKSLPFPVLSAASAPALFTTNGAGTGNAAAFQIDPVKGDFTLNSDKTPATKGAILVLYATGVGPPLPIPLDGLVATEASTISIANVSVLLGDVVAEVLYAGAAPGLITGIVQINARVPEGTPTGKAVPITLKVDNAASPAGVTLNIK